jgi:hypothetical protein
MKTTSLASSRKAWRLIQSLISRVVTNGGETIVGGDDSLNMTIPQAGTGHPFKVTRSGNTVRMQTGLVSSFSGSALPATWAVTDNGGFNVGSFSAWIVLRMTTMANAPYIITNPIESYYIVQAGGQTIAPLAEISDPAGYLGAYNIVTQTVTESQIAVPVAYVTNNTTHQLLKTNISIMPQANHHNLFTFI